MSSLWGVLSDTSNIMCSNLLHFATLYLISVFPTSLFSRHLPSIPLIIPTPKSQLLYGLALLIFNISFVSSIPNTIFCGFHRKPIKLSPPLKSLLSSSPPLLPTKLAYSITFVAILSAFGICTALVFYVMILLGLDIEAATTICFTALVFITLILFAVLFAYLCVEWCLMDAIVVEESKYGLERVTGMRSVAFLMITMLGISKMVIERGEIGDREHIGRIVCVLYFLYISQCTMHSTL